MNKDLLLPGIYSATITSAQFVLSSTPVNRKTSTEVSFKQAIGRARRSMEARVTRIDLDKAERFADHMLKHNIEYIVQDDSWRVLWLKSKGKQPRRVKVMKRSCNLVIDFEVCNSKASINPNWSRNDQP